MRSPLDRFEKSPKQAPFVDDQHIFRPVSPARRLRGKVILAAFMGVATLATGLFIQVKLSRQPPTLAAVAQEQRPQEAAPTQERAMVQQRTVQPEKTRSVDLAAVSFDPIDDDDVGTLGHQDPRWVREATTALPTPKPKTVQDDPKPQAATEEVLAYADPEPQATDGADEEFTAAIPPKAIKPQVEQRDDSVSDDNADAGRSTKVLRAVNLRANPRSGSRVIKVLPAGATVGLVNCNGWCEVTYQGTRGFIYKSFVGKGGGATARSKPRRTILKISTKTAPVERKTLTLR